MKVDGHISGPRRVSRRLDVADRPPDWKPGDVRRDVRPSAAAVAGQLDKTVVCAGPDTALFYGGFSDGEDDTTVFDGEVVRGEPSRRSQFRGIVGRQIGTDQGPAPAGVGRHVDILAAHVNPVMVMGRNMDREGPVEPVFDGLRRRAVERFGPRLDTADVACFIIRPLEVRVIASAPDDGRIDRINDHVAAFAAGRGFPERPRRGPILPPRVAAARAFIGHPVLPSSVDAVRNLVIHRNVVHLGDGEIEPPPGPAPIEGDRGSAVVADHEPVRVRRVGPEIMGIAAPGNDLIRITAVERPAHGVRGEIDLVRISGIHEEPGRVVRAFVEEAGIARQPPILAIVVRPP